jgi:trans-aconitate methyltransferase
MADWDPELYNRFRRYRAEPVEHILSRLQLADNELIIDRRSASTAHPR